MQYSPVILHVSAVEEVRSTLPAEIKYYCFGEFAANKVSGATHLDPLLQKASSSDPIYRPNTTITDPFLFIYTSGTTGLPKPAIVSHLRYVTSCSRLYLM